MKNLLSNKLEDNIIFVNDKFKDCPDIKRQKLLLKDGSNAFLVYTDGLVAIDILQRDIIPSLIHMESKNIFDDNLQTTYIPTAESSISDNLDALIEDILSGRAVIFINGYDRALSISITKYEKRNITSSEIEKNVRGSNEAFIESINSNISILRRRIKNPKLKFKMLKVGKLTNQAVAIAYIEGLANPDSINIVYNKLTSIEHDSVYDVGYLEHLLIDNPYTPFPHFLVTERPDKTVSFLDEGRLAILLDGSPSALLMPISFFSAFQALDDYNTNWLVGSLSRFIRIVALFMAIFLPSLYIAIVSYHYYMVPLNLLVPLAESRAKVPFPPIVEILILEFTIEMLREATIRLPTFIGTSIGIVGGLIIGQAAVNAGIVSNLVIIIVAVTALASYLIPNYDMGLAVKYIRFIVMFFSSIFGIIGVIICSLFILAHLVVLESLGEPYFKPVLPFNLIGFKDTLTRPLLKPQNKSATQVKATKNTRSKNNG